MLGTNNMTNTTTATDGTGAAPLHHHHHNHHTGATGMTGGPGMTGAGEDVYRLETDRENKYAAAPHTTIFLKPIAAPSALGLASYAGGTFVVASWLAMWWGGTGSVIFMWPFVFVYGGLAQILAGMWAYNARDTLATVFHTTWGSFLLSISLLWAFQAANTVPLFDQYERNSFLGSWMVSLAVITLVCSLAAMVRDLVTALTLLLLGVGCIFAAIGWYAPSKACLVIAGYLWLVSCLTAVGRMAAHLLVEAFPGRYSHGTKDMMPRMRNVHRNAMYEQGWKDGSNEPGVVKGNL